MFLKISEELCSLNGIRRLILMIFSIRRVRGVVCYQLMNLDFTSDYISQHDLKMVSFTFYVHIHVHIFIDSYCFEFQTMGILSFSLILFVSEGNN